MIDDAQDRLRRYAFPAAALSDDAQRLSRGDVERSAVDGFGRSLVLEETGPQIPDRKKWPRIVLHDRCAASRLEVGVGRIPHPVPHEIESEDRNDDGNGREKKPRRYHQGLDVL